MCLNTGLCLKTELLQTALSMFSCPIQPLKKGELSYSCFWNILKPVEFLTQQTKLEIYSFQVGYFVEM